MVCFKGVFVVYSLSLPKDAKNIGFKLRLFKEESKKEIHILGPVVSVDMSHRIMYPHLFSFQLTFKEIKEYWSQERINFSWNVQVLKSKENEIVFVKMTKTN